MSLLSIILCLTVIGLVYTGIKAFSKRLNREAEQFNSLFFQIEHAYTIQEWSSLFQKCTQFLTGAVHPQKEAWDAILKAKMLTQQIRIRNNYSGYTQPVEA